MKKISPALKKRLMESPETRVNLILRTKGDPKKYLGRLEAKGIRTTRAFSLLAAVAIQGPAKNCLQLLKEAWVERLEEDREVRAL